MSFRFGVLSILATVILAACGERGAFYADPGSEILITKQVEKTDRNLTPRNTYVIEMPDQAPLIVGALNARNLELSFDKTSQKYKLVGGYDIVDKSGTVLSSQNFELTGANRGDHPVLSPAFDDSLNEERVRAAVTCLTRDAEDTCKKVILDLVVKKKGAKENFATQLEIDLQNKTVVEQKPASPKPEAPKAETPKVETPKTEVPPKEAPKAEPPKVETPKTETPKAETPKTETPKTDAPPSAPSPTDLSTQDHENDEDEDQDAGLYVGTLYQDSDSLFTMNGQDGVEKTPPAQTPKAEAPKTETPKPSPKPPVSTPAPAPSPKPAPTTSQRRATDRDQAVGMASNGTLEHPTSLMDSMRKGEAPAVMLIYPSRERYYGTWELIDSLEKMSNYMRQSVLPGYTMAIGDIAQKEGGRLVGSAHKSHQNGLDVDVAYPMMNVQELSFTDLVARGHVSTSLRLKETFQLFEYAQKNLRNVDRIFVDSKIKKALCDMSAQQGMLDSGRATEVLRRLRPADGHDNHFHLRIRCSPQQPRCRMMAEPPAGSGCEAVR